jgi:hypothetical protein
MGYIGWTNRGREQKKPVATQGPDASRPRDNDQGHPAESELVQQLRGLGALLYCKTAVPHTLISGETINNIIGYVWNQKHRLLSAGGSSGGEGALLALRGSPIGIESDIGGSIRIPAAFNGLYGLKPSSGRIPYQGAVTSMDGQNSLLSVLGPMSPPLDSLRLLMRSVIDARPWLYDPMVVEIPWRDAVYNEILCPKKQLAFGVLRTNDQASVQPPVSCALRLVVNALKKLDHQVIDWTPPSHKIGVDLVVRPSAQIRNPIHFTGLRNVLEPESADVSVRCSLLQEADLFPYSTTYGPSMAAMIFTRHSPCLVNPQPSKHSITMAGNRQIRKTHSTLLQQTSRNVTIRSNIWTTGTVRHVSRLLKSP